MSAETEELFKARMDAKCWNYGLSWKRPDLAIVASLILTDPPKALEILVLADEAIGAEQRSLRRVEGGGQE